MNIVSYEDRVAKMMIVGDEDKQLRLAKSYVKRIRSLAKKAGTLEEKIKLQAAQKKAELVVNKLRQNIFDLEDMLLAKTG